MNDSHGIRSITLVGFDVRISPSLAGRLLQKNRQREKYLVAQNSTYVLSADRYVWPSVFFTEGGTPLLREMHGRSISVAPENAFFAAFDLWDNALEMAEAAKPLSDPTCGIAVGLTNASRYGTQFVGDSWFNAIHEGFGVSPGTVGSDWPCLGFDVVNSGLTSALSGFGPLDDLAVIQAELAGLVNSYGLLVDQSASIRFCQSANRRYSSDGPFFSLAIFLLWDDSGELSESRVRLKNQDA